MQSDTLLAAERPLLDGPEHAEALRDKVPVHVIVSSDSRSEVHSGLEPADAAAVHARNGRPGMGLQDCYVTGEGRWVQEAHMLPASDLTMPELFTLLRAIGAVPATQNARDMITPANIVVLSGTLHAMTRRKPAEFLLAPTDVERAIKVVELYMAAQEVEHEHSELWRPSLNDIDDWTAYRAYLPSYFDADAHMLECTHDEFVDGRSKKWVSPNFDASKDPPRHFVPRQFVEPLPTKLLPLAFIVALYFYYMHARSAILLNATFVETEEHKLLMSRCRYLCRIFEQGTPSQWRDDADLRAALQLEFEAPPLVATSHAQRVYVYDDSTESSPPPPSRLLHADEDFTEAEHCEFERVYAAFVDGELGGLLPGPATAATLGLLRDEPDRFASLRAFGRLAKQVKRRRRAEREERGDGELEEYFYATDSSDEDDWSGHDEENKCAIDDN